MSTPSLPEDIKPSTRTTKLMRDQQNTRILDFIKGGASDQFIISKLGLSQRTFERRMKEIRKQHMNEIIDQQQAEAKASLLRICQDKIKWLDIQMQNIVLDQNQKTFDRILAADRSRQYQMDIAKLSIEGPTIFRITKDGLYRRNDNSFLESGDTPILSETTPAEAAITNSERQF